MMRAMILSAGRGERMRPLTDTLPKALIPVKHKPLIVYHLEKLSAMGIKDVVINVSYLADKMRDALGDGKRWNVNIHYSFEPEILETGGGIFNALPLLGPEPFLLISCDIYTDYDFKQLILPKHSLAHLVLAPNPNYHPQGDFDLDKEGRVVDTPHYTYASMGVFHPDFFKNCSPGKFSIVPLLRKHIDNNQISGELYKGLWYNVGTQEELKKLSHLP